MVDPKTKAVICTTFAAGQEHDFHRPLASTRGTRARQWTHLFKRSRVKIKKETLRSGRQGLSRNTEDSCLKSVTQKEAQREAVESVRLADKSKTRSKDSGLELDKRRISSRLST